MTNPATPQPDTAPLQEADIKRLMVEMTHLVDVAYTHYAEFLDKNALALEAPTPEDAIALYQSAAQHVLASQPIWHNLVNALLGVPAAITEVHEAFARFTNGKPN